MAATREDITRWLRAMRADGATHLIVKCDGFGDPLGDCCYPVYVMPGEDARQVASENRDRTMEVYSAGLSDDYQLAERRAFHWEAS